MTSRHLTFASLLCGALALAVVSLLDNDPVVIAASFPFGALTFLLGHEVFDLIRVNRERAS